MSEQTQILHGMVVSGREKVSKHKGRGEEAWNRARRNYASYLAMGTLCRYGSQVTRLVHVAELRRTSLVSQVNGGKLASSRVLFDRTRKKGKFRQRESIACSATARCHGEGKFPRVDDNGRVEIELARWDDFSHRLSKSEIRRVREGDRVRRVLDESVRDAAGGAGVGQRDPAVGQRGDTALRFSARKLCAKNRETHLSRREGGELVTEGDRC